MVAGQWHEIQIKMATTELRKSNHFVPKMSLRHWAVDGRRVYMYRLLVSSEKVPAWRHVHVRSVARHEHLYTRVAGGACSDDFERWLDRDFESPASLAVEKAVNGKRLSKVDWYNLVRFLAAQDVRTPARLAEGMRRWRSSVPLMIETITRDAVQRIEQGHLKVGKEKAPAYGDLLPIRVSTQQDETGTAGTIKVETDIGRGYWLFQIRHLLTKTAEILHKHRWSILTPSVGVEWVTSDDPVVKLNYHSEERYDFGGGWDSPGSEILMPVGPRCLMYTRIGTKNLDRIVHLDAHRSLGINRLLIRHAHRAVFATFPNAAVPNTRARTVDANAVAQENKQWLAWASEISQVGLRAPGVR